MKAKHSRPISDQLLATLARARRVETQSFDDAWVGIEPTFSNKKAVKRWARCAGDERAEDAYFESAFMIDKLREVARSIKKRYRSAQKRGDAACVFADCELEFDSDPWKVERANLRFRNANRGGDFEVRLGLDPETFEFSIKPIPLVWFYDERFVRFLQLCVWDVPQARGLSASMAHGGGQFSFSAKTFLTGSLLADDIATRLNHPELACWSLDYPNADDRAFRATTRRRRAFESLLKDYWRGAFHPRATGILTVENAFLDRGFEAAERVPAGLMNTRRGPSGNKREVFQTNFAFGRAVRWRGQYIDPGYWQSAHPHEDGYRPDQIMRYSEGNLNRLQIAGEWHVKSGALLDPKRIRALDAPLELSMLYDEASWEQRAQMSKTSAVDMTEAILLEAHHAKWLADHPHVTIRTSIAQDALLGDAERTLERAAPKRLAKLRSAARKLNLEGSRERVKSERVEPETLFWAAWHAMRPGEQAEIAREALLGFVEHVTNAAACDPRTQRGDPMEAHRHRIHPLLWKALRADVGALERSATLRREALKWSDRRDVYLARRPKWSVTKIKAPWSRGD